MSVSELIHKSRSARTSIIASYRWHGRASFELTIQKDAIVPKLAFKHPVVEHSIEPSRVYQRAFVSKFSAVELASLPRIIVFVFIACQIVSAFGIAICRYKLTTIEFSVFPDAEIYKLTSVKNSIIPNRIVFERLYYIVVFVFEAKSKIIYKPDIKSGSIHDKNRPYTIYCLIFVHQIDRIYSIRMIRSCPSAYFLIRLFSIAKRSSSGRNIL